MWITNRVTIVESEKDDFRSEFNRTRNRKGFRDTKLNGHYYEEVRAKALIINTSVFNVMMANANYTRYCGSVV